MRQRSIGTVTVAFMSLMIALYAQIGAVPLLLGGSVFADYGSLQGAAALVLGALFLWLTIVAYAVGYGTWMRKRWSWTGALVVFTALIAVNVMLALLSAIVLVAVLPMLGAIAGLWLLSRPAVKAELRGSQVQVCSSVRASEGFEVPEGAHSA